MDLKIIPSSQATTTTTTTAQATKRSSNPVDERIKNLLVSTDLTFKQIIEQLKSEGLTASFNTIRRVNRNNRFRKPRYDAKLTPSQRRQLISQLKTEKKPNLSLLAKQYGVCHGSIWYWWDKLTRLREKNGEIEADDVGRDDADEPDEVEDMLSEDGEMMDDMIDLNRLQFIGSVRAKSREGGYIDLPISMYT